MKTLKEEHKKVESSKVFTRERLLLYKEMSPGGSDGKESACNAGNPGLIPELGISPGEGNANPL